MATTLSINDADDSKQNTEQEPLLTTSENIGTYNKRQIGCFWILLILAGLYKYAVYANYIYLCMLT